MLLLVYLPGSAGICVGARLSAAFQVSWWGGVREIGLWKTWMGWCVTDNFLSVLEQTYK